MLNKVKETLEESKYILKNYFRRIEYLIRENKGRKISEDNPVFSFYHTKDVSFVVYFTNDYSGCYNSGTGTIKLSDNLAYEIEQLKREPTIENFKKILNVKLLNETMSNLTHELTHKNDPYLKTKYEDNNYVKNMLKNDEKLIKSAIIENQIGRRPDDKSPYPDFEITDETRRLMEKKYKLYFNHITEVNSFIIQFCCDTLNQNKNYTTFNEMLCDLKLFHQERFYKYLNKTNKRKVEKRLYKFYNELNEEVCV